MTTLLIGNVEILSQTETDERHHQDGLELTNEAGLYQKNPPWLHCDQVIRALDTGHGNSYCCLATPGNTYVQSLRGINGYMLEWRITDAVSQSHIHYRACYLAGSARSVVLRKHDTLQEPGEQRDLVNVDDVADAFRAFYHSAGMPAWLEWRKLDI